MVGELKKVIIVDLIVKLICAISSNTTSAVSIFSLITMEWQQVKPKGTYRYATFYLLKVTDTI
jgi:hypothetical protein